MTNEDITKRVVEALVRVAPEIDPAGIRPDATLRDEYDLDSMDFLNFVVGLHDAFGIDIPEADYPALTTLAGCVRYVQDHAVERPSTAEPAVRAPRAPHRFDCALRWERGGEGAAAVNHTVAFPNRPPLAMSAPPAFRGDASRISPEELFVASVASCQLLTYLALAARAGLAIERYEDRPSGTLAMADRRMRMTEICLRPRITLGAGGDAAKARSLVAAAHDACFVASSITTEVRIEPEVVVA
jgi:acyl carrier protein